ncbi:autotransporter domain-containing protein [Fusobacterium varium]|uniref:autotransporter family protein n=1 Tax=Fusobacterium varium TaxID=856 RepID=UPI0032BF908E
MIEKVMKVVKSSNKKRSRNITIGAVIGFLLSCTAVMGADDNYLWIKKDSGEIKFSIDNNTTPFSTENPYDENTWNRIDYINNITLSGTNNLSGSEGYGLRLSEDLGNFNFINNGVITGTGDSLGYGIYNESGSITTLVNNGLMTGTGYDVGSGINNEGGSITNLVNSGLILGTGNYDGGYGINNEGGSITNLVNSGLIIGTGNNGSSGISNSGSITTLVNSGLIIGTGDNNNSGDGIGNSDSIETLTNSGLIIGTGNDGSGIYNYYSSITNLVNSGLILGTGDSNGYGIYNSDGSIETLTNTGVIYGKDNAIKNESGTITTAKNYGILVSGDENEDTLKNVGLKANYGLIFKELGGSYSATETDFAKFGITSPGDTSDNYTVINARAKGDKNNIIGTESLKLENGTLSYNDSDNKAKVENISSDKRYILNGITNTLEVSGKHNELNNSTINAYETAVVMNGKESMLTLNNTVVNGGISGKNTVKIEGDGNTLNVQGNSIINGLDTAITVTGDNNALVLEGNVVVNGKMESTGNNILSLNGNAEDGMNIYHDITGFVNMNIENNVTFFEDVKVTGTETVTVDKDGVLNLRLKKDIITYNTIPTAVHAFSGIDSTIIKGASEEEAGTLNFITNGIGREIYVDMKNIELENMKVRANSIIDKVEISDEYIHLGAGSDLSGIVNPKVSKYDSLDGIYKSLYSSTDENLDALRDILSMTYLGKNYDYNNATDEEQLKTLMSYLDSIYTGTPYSYSSELSRKSMGMFRDIITDNQFRPDLNRWLVMGGLTHTDGGTKDSYYGQNYHGIDTGTADVDVDMKLTGAYALGKYGYSENVALGVTVGGNKSEAKLPMSKVKGNSGYIGAFAENYRGNLTLKAGTGIQYSEYDANRATLGGHSYSDKYSDMTYDIYLNGRYSHNIGNNLFLEPYGTLSYTYIKQDSADEGNKVLAIETDSKSFDYTAAKVGLDLKKVIPHEKGKSTLSAGVSYTRLLTGADEENITGRFKGGSDFDILVAHKNEHSIGLNAKYALELENGILFDVKGSYNVERDSHNGNGKNRTKGEWIVGAGLGYKF